MQLLKRQNGSVRHGILVFVEGVKWGEGMEKCMVLICTSSHLFLPQSRKFLHN